MFTTQAQQEFKQALKQFNAAKEAEYSYAYTAGYCESMVVEMFGQLTKKQQKFFATQIQKELDKLAV
jgi:hypothetical protein